ncbi:acetyl-CoA carboxylase biotin carboxylase subunit [Brevirhabdus pacifica]|uniref:acetyl-CoA carboxylase biotin carboxylase subunit n=1 Tax=Brevirhabdus pacifica TaxID=1267768 RepID=UPI0009F94DCE|nr:biotin carboxylase N-terminal domain-containing protein [Brevirhabdus pacifica]PJJ86384.1 acetyl-CoA carboxylase biotin carboxylase subunit [Brevirhabdus pacifica]
MNLETGFDRVLIANRGEIALRAVRVCRALGLQTVAVHSAADAAQPHVFAADRAVCVGPAAAQRSYLNAAALVHVALETGCGAIYPGYGFLAENAEFAELCAANGLKFIGPSAEAIRTMGDKSRARETAEGLGVPVVPGSPRAYDTLAEAEEAAAAVGYPMLLKARSGGGGRGMRIVESADGFARAFSDAHREAEAAFDDGAIYLERFFAKVRHIEVQVLGDGAGGSVEFDERDCSVQRRHQKLVEESPSPVVGASLRQRLKEAAGKLTRGIRYEGAGTLEFILDPATQEFFFIEMNTRIQVEHTVTEERIGLDLIAAQIRIARGEGLDEAAAAAAGQGHAIEYRINAEDWQRDFQPAPGELTGWRVPAGPGLRLDAASCRGQRVSPFYDSMIAKLIVHGADREQAIARSRAALAGFGVEGVATTIGFHRMLLEHDDFLANRVHTRWIETELNAPPAAPEASDDAPETPGRPAPAATPQETEQA